MGYSFPFGIPLVFFPILLFVFWRSRGAWWGWAACGLFLAAVAYFLYLAVSEKEYLKIKKSHTELNRLTWLMNWLLFFVIGPMAAWAAVLAAVLRN